MNLLVNLYDPKRTGIIGPRFELAITNTVLAVLYDTQPSFLKVIKCFTDKTYLSQLVTKISDRVLIGYFEKMKKPGELNDFILSKLLPLINDKRLNILQESSNYSQILEEIIKNKQTIILDSSIFKYEADKGCFVYGLLFFKLEQILQKNKSSNTVSVYIDEVQLAREELASLYRFSGRYGLAITAVSTRALLIPEYLQYEISRTETVVSFKQSIYDNDYVEELFENKSLKNEVNLLCLPQFNVHIKTLNHKGGIKIGKFDLSK
jgi:hypothetical protein